MDTQQTQQSDATAMHTQVMREAIEICRKGIEAGQSPFGAVIATTDGKVIYRAHNTVRSTCDATAHAEITAIRGACQELGLTNLTGHIMATTCEPCPMCATAIHWARLEAVVYGAGIGDAHRLHFNELTVPIQSLFLQGESAVQIFPHVLRDDCLALFKLWKEGPNPNPY